MAPRRWGILSSRREFFGSLRHSRRGAGATSALASLCVPDRARRLIIPPFAPYRLRRAIAVDRKPEIISERKTKPALQNVVVSPHRARELRLRAPRGAAVGRTAVISIPERTVRIPRFRRSRIHPSNSHIARSARHQRRKRMFHTCSRVGNVGPLRPACPAGGGRRKINPLGPAIRRARVPQRIERSRAIRGQRNLRTQISGLATLCVAAGGRARHIQQGRVPRSPAIRRAAYINADRARRQFLARIRGPAKITLPAGSTVAPPASDEPGPAFVFTCAAAKVCPASCDAATKNFSS